jgi:transcriptional regulator with XRE-family HTH domain
MPKTAKSLEFYLSVGNKIKLARKLRQVDQEELAANIGLSRSSVINIEKGRQNPSLLQVWSAARFLNVPITDLIPPSDFDEQLETWKEKVDSQIVNSEGKKTLLDFISTNTRLKNNF